MKNLPFELKEIIISFIEFDKIIILNKNIAKRLYNPNIDYFFKIKIRDIRILEFYINNNYEKDLKRLLKDLVYVGNYKFVKWLYDNGHVERWRVQKYCMKCNNYDILRYVLEYNY